MVIEGIILVLLGVAIEWVAFNIDVDDYLAAAMYAVGALLLLIGVIIALGKWPL